MMSETNDNSQRKRSIDKVTCLFWLAIVVLGLVIVVLIGPFVVDSYKRYTFPHAASRCGSNLKGLANAMVVYAHEYGNRYPPPEKWCDVFLEGDWVDKSDFICRTALAKHGEARSHYAVNPSCEPNSPADIVFLFETKGGWNQFGGREILTIGNHSPKGCNVVFSDGRVEFVGATRVDKLKWKVWESEE